MSNEQDYQDSFGVGGPYARRKAQKALDHALDIRKFEIGLYWQRAAYFWALITVAFAGYFAILGADHLDDKEYLAYIVSCIGLLFTWAWFLVNRGSKQWQENWENHVDMLEDTIIGPLYKTTLHRSEESKGFDTKYITGPASISVSQVNQWVSTFTLAIWLVLVCNSLQPVSFSLRLSWRRVLVGVITVIFAVLMRLRGATHDEDRTVVMKQRRTSIQR